MVTSEWGEQAEFSVVLRSQPTSPVKIPLGLDKPLEASLSAAELTFDTSNWNLPQRITITGQSDQIDDEDSAVRVQFGAFESQDANYAGRV